MKCIGSKICLKVKEYPKHLPKFVNSYHADADKKMLQLSPAASRVGFACMAHFNFQDQFNRINIYL